MRLPDVLHHQDVDCSSHACLPAATYDAMYFAADGNLGSEGYVGFGQLPLRSFTVPPASNDLVLTFQLQDPYQVLAAGDGHDFHSISLRDGSDLVRLRLLAHRGRVAVARGYEHHVLHCGVGKQRLPSASSSCAVLFRYPARVILTCRITFSRELERVT